ncbi:MAG TPA: hypothetical protein VGQ15_10680 [Gaiellaceae bacterium]|jgi:hypothetical protein|nr:hypothetical protein [Gaiellaceae bacterium]
MSRIMVIAGVAALGVLVLASLAHGRTTQAGGPALSGPYLGSYAATLTRAQAAARGDSRLAGRFTLVLRSNGTYTASNALDGRTNGRLAALANHRLRFYDDSGCKSGGFERPQGGVYRWSLNGARLTLRLVSEGPCTGRTATLTYPVWTRK